MPVKLAEWGCDELLWNSMPMGAHKDLTRFVCLDEESTDELAKNRIQTMKDILAFHFMGGPGGAWDRMSWDNAMAAWSQEEADKRQRAKDAIKAERAAARAALRAAKEAEEGDQNKADE